MIVVTESMYIAGALLIVAIAIAWLAIATGKSNRRRRKNEEEDSA